MSIILVSIFGVWLAVVLLVFGGYYRKALHTLWREPMLRHPVLVFESDDWGPGKEEQARQLGYLIETLQAYQDAWGRHPVMTLGIVLGVPNTEKNKASGLSAFHRLTLAEPRFQAIRTAMQRGVEAGVFSLQLHGLEHYWPAALLTVAARDMAVKEWLTGEPLPDTERLPAALQSRWIDGSQLPSRPLDEREVEQAAREEVALFANIFGFTPAVLVPPTFVWPTAVERGWVAAGGRTVVTPGQRYEARDAANKLIPGGPPIHNGDRSPAGMLYVVRNDYFEPAYGHKAEHALEALLHNNRAARPTLLETHRCNFTRDPALAEASLRELRRLLDEVLRRCPDVAFLSTEAIAQAFGGGDPSLLEDQFSRRVQAWLQRWRDTSRLWSWAKLTGFAVVIVVLQLVLRQEMSVGLKGDAMEGGRND